jgi:DNA-binding response OmpR family regulator
MSKILIVEDDESMRRGLRDNLVLEGYDVDTEGDGEGGLDALRTGRYDLLILDVMLPVLSGIDLLRKAKEERIATRVIMLTARSEEIDKVVGLELGADDYVTKPFSLRELLARVKAVLRRVGPEGERARETVLQLGDVRIDFAAYAATKHGAPVDMTPKEVDVLRYLCEREGETVSRTDLLEHVWGYAEEISSRTVDNVIVRLRQKIESDPSHPRHILTMHGVGYKFVGAAERARS